MHRIVHRLSCYMNIPKYSKLFIQIIRETSVRENDCPGNVLYGNHLVRESSCPGKVLSGKRLVRETSVRESDCPGNVCYPKRGTTNRKLLLLQTWKENGTAEQQKSKFKIGLQNEKMQPDNAKNTLAHVKNVGLSYCITVSYCTSD